MRITYAPRGILQIDDARLVYRNFAGAASKFNREGDRNFAVVIDDPDLVDELINRGWNVRVKPPRDEDDTPFAYLPVKIDEESIGCLDNLDIMGVDLDVRPYDWTVNGKDGRTAYLQSIHVVQEVDRFAERYL